MALASLIRRLRLVLGDGSVVTGEAASRGYECDGLTSYPAAPGVVVLPTGAEQVRFAVRECVRSGVPFVTRCAGPGPGRPGRGSPPVDGVLIVTSRMRQVIEVDVPNQRVIVEPGAPNLTVSEVARGHGYCVAPDPDGLVAGTLGENVAENSGGARHLKYGSMAGHVTGLEICTPEGELVWLGTGRAVEAPGYDLVGVFVGAQGTLGVATKVAVRLTPVPEAAVALLAVFRSPAEAEAAVGAIVATGPSPAAVEIMDVVVVDVAGGADRPLTAGAVLQVECDGPAAEVEAQVAVVDLLCRRAGGFSVRRASSQAERADLRWECAAAPAVSKRILPGPPRTWTDEDFDTMRLLRRAFDPRGLASPGTVLPATRAVGSRHRRCGSREWAGARAW